MTIKIHLDTDLGGDLDDLCALAMLLRWPGLDLAGITTVCENDGKRAGFVRYALHLEGRDDVPVAAGADGKDGYYRVKPGLPPEERYWRQEIRPHANPLFEALDLLKHRIEQDAIVIAIGSLTNLFLLDRLHPGILQDASLFIMGGYIFPIRSGFPNWGNEMDWNFQSDIVSARHVLENSNPTLIPLSVTVETSLRRAYLPRLSQAGALGHLLAHQAEVFAEDEKNETRFGMTCAGLPEDTINFQHDPLACAVALGWNEGVEIKDLPLVFKEVDGWLVEHISSAGKPVQVVTKVDGPSFNKFWIDRTCGQL